MKKMFAVLVALVWLFTGCEYGITPNGTQIKISIDTPEPTTAESHGLEDFMKDKKVTLTAKDVQFDMENNLDMPFGIEGYAELSDYYNYGYVNYEKECFCMRITPVGESYSDAWYIYVGRDYAPELFNALKEGKVYVYAICKVYKEHYEQGQGNMAFVVNVAY
jgi:hypothetical protein